jgi:tRNA(Ile)-lysidine synthase
MAGLAAIPAQRGRFLRPSLAIGRDTIDAYVRAQELPVWNDPMNEDRRLARVRVRRDILPALRRENPQLDAALLRLAGSAAEWLEVIDGLTRPFARFPIDCAALAAWADLLRRVFAEDVLVSRAAVAATSSRSSPTPTKCTASRHARASRRPPRPWHRRAPHPKPKSPGRHGVAPGDRHTGQR